MLSRIDALAKLRAQVAELEDAVQRSYIGKLGYFWDGREDRMFIGRLLEYRPGKGFSYITYGNFIYKNFRPATRQEVESWIAEE